MTVLEGVSRADSEQLKIVFCAAGMLLALAWTRVGRTLAQQSLRALALLALINYGRWGTKVPFERVDTYDLLHYYVNAKFFDELGYYDLYPAILHVDRQNGGPHFPEQGNLYMAQDGAGHHIEPIAHALARGAEVERQRFTPARWDAFSHDVLALQRGRPGLTQETWRQMIQDHGFNGTPSWTLVARPFTWVPVEWIKWLCWTDALLLGAALLLAGRAFGADTAWWLLLWLSVSYSLRWPTVTWALNRYDYVAALLAAVSLVKLGRYRLAGAAVGFAAMMRLFPVLWMWGPLAKGIAGLVQRVVHRPLLHLALGFCLAAGALQLGAVARFGTDAVATHVENMADHNRAEQLSSRRIGLALALVYDGAVLPKILTRQAKERIEAQRPVRYLLAGTWMVAVGWALRRARDEEALAFGFLPFFLLTTASYYYYVTRITLTAIHAADLDRLRNRVGLGALFAMELFCNAAETVYPEHRWLLIGGLAWLLAAYAMGLGAWLLWEARSNESASVP